MLLQICENLPREIQGLLACCNPVPPLVRTHVVHLHRIILAAKGQPLEKVIIGLFILVGIFVLIGGTAGNIEAG